MKKRRSKARSHISADFTRPATRGRRHFPFLVAPRDQSVDDVAQTVTGRGTAGPDTWATRSAKRRRRRVDLRATSAHHDLEEHELGLIAFASAFL